MTARILRRLKAARDAEEIADYIARDSLEAAVRFLEDTETTLKDLAASPSSGSPFASDHPELADLRYRRVKGFPNHLIFYIERKDAIDVVRILHGARDLDAELRKS
jgi:toxin ParE1/3/4